MAHIFNDMTDFPTRLGRNAQRGHCATVLFLFIQTRGLAALHKSIYLSGAKRLVLLSDSYAQHVPNSVSLSLSLSLSVSLSFPLDYHLLINIVIPKIILIKIKL